MFVLGSASCVGGDGIANALATVLVQQCRRRAIARAVRPSISCKRRISAQRETFMGISVDGRGRGIGQAAKDLAEGGQTAAATLERGGGQGEHLRQRRR